MLEVRDLTSAYGGIVAVRGVSLRVAAGRCVALIGSPTAPARRRCCTPICGLMRPATGEHHVPRRRISPGQPAYRVARKGILLVPEGRQILGPLSVRENLELGRLALGGTSGRLRMRTSSACYELFPRLAERLEQLAGSLSGGEQQMLAIGRALMGGPDILLLDEPSLGLAPIVVSTVFETLKRLNRGGPHHPAGRAECAARAGNRQLRLRDGARTHRR